MYRCPCILLILAASALWCLLASFVPLSTYWRDSGEFILTAYYLDVAHPAGFPLYSQLANLLALLPIGPIAWRINTFSCLIGFTNLVLLFLLTHALLRGIAELSKAAHILLALVPLLILGSTEAFLRQTFTAEVYNLNTLVILVLLLLYVRFENTSDRRCIIACGFIGGLGLANHAALAITLLPAVCIIGSDVQLLRKIALPTLIAGMVGISTYAYIPLRAQHNLPLNTGDASNFSRLINHLSNARDRELRALDSTAVDSSLVHFKTVSDTALLRALKNDLRTMQRESDPILLVAGAFGLLLLMVHRTRLGLLALGSAGTCWFFFLGWDADPWLPLFAAVGLGCAYLAAFFITKFPRSDRQQALASAALLLLVIAMHSPAQALEDLRRIRSFDVPAEAAAAALERLPRNGVYLSEASWFLLNYAQHIEGLRGDVALVYQPSVLFPVHFVPVKLKAADGAEFDSRALKLSTSDQAAPQEQRLAAFTDFITRYQNLHFEPNMILNRFFSSVVQCGDDGAPRLERGKDAACSASFADWYNRYLNRTATSTHMSWQGFSADTAHFYETQLTNAASLLRESGSVSAARGLLTERCLGQKPTLCKLTSFNNLATYYMEEGNYAFAAKLLLALQIRYPDSAAVQTNLALALQHLDSKAAQELLNKPAADLSELAAP